MEQEDITPTKFILYKILDIPNNATQGEIKKRYYALSKICHPDKCPDDPEATTNFQKLCEAYKILSDPEKRKVYDKTGDVADLDYDLNTFISAYQYYRNMYKEITTQDIADFSKTYPGSKDEKEDLMDYYWDYEGDMDGLLECIPLSKVEDVPRFIEYFDSQIKSGEIDEFIEVFNETKGTIRELKCEEDELKKLQEEEEFKSLQQTIMCRQKQRNGNQMDFISMMEMKYAEGTKNKKAKTGANKENKKVKTNKKIVKGGVKKSPAGKKA